MAFTLEQVVPWGRSYDEYIQMFALSQTDLEKRILGCGDGPAGFNAQLSQQGGRVISVDPIYEFSAKKIKKRIEQTFKTVLDQTKNNQDEFIWRSIKDVEELGKIRMKAMNRFLEDYPRGKKDGRYIEGSLPDLPLFNDKFDLALCSHFLFLYSEHFDAKFHLESIVNLCKIANEVRIFPLLELGSKKSRHFDEVIKKLTTYGFKCEVKKVKYEFQKGGNELLVIK